jgi:DHA2 family multidrug resistance protein
VIIPQWLQTSMGYTAQDAGLATAFTAMTAIVTSLFAARLANRVDARFLVSGAVIWLGCMAILRTHWTSGADFWTLAMPQLLQGFAMPFFMIPLTTLSLSSVEPSEMASAAGLQSFLRTMAVALATSVSLTIWGDSQRVMQNDIVARLQPADVQNQLANAGFTVEQSRQMIANIVNQEAVTMAVDHTFLVTAGVLFVAAMVVWLGPAPRKKVDISAAH